jgi:hypothetical protein
MVTRLSIWFLIRIVAALAPLGVLALQVGTFEHPAKIGEVSFTKGITIFDGTAIHVPESIVSGRQFASVGSLIGRETEYIHSQFSGWKDREVSSWDIFVSNLWQNRNWLPIYYCS